MRFRLVWFATTCAALMAISAMTAGDVDGAKRSKAKSTPKVEPIKVEMFAAKKAGEIEVTLIPKDATTSTILIKNKTDKPLSIALPEAFAGVPVLAQFGGGGGGFGGGGLGGGGGGLGGGGGGGGQGLGGGLGGGGGGGLGGGGGFGGGGLGGGFFSVEPEKVRKIKVATVCLEHGKDDPNPRMKYDIVPIGSFTKDQNVIEICKMLGRGEIPQNSAQAATWHLTDDLSWQQLAVKNKVEFRTIGYAERFFTLQELALATRIVGEATRRAKNAKPEYRSPGEIEEQQANKQQVAGE